MGNTIRNVLDKIWVPVRPTIVSTPSRETPESVVEQTAASELCRPARVPKTSAALQPVGTDVAQGTGEARAGPRMLSLVKLFYAVVTSRLFQLKPLTTTRVTSLEISGIENVQNASGHFKFRGPVVWLPTHTEQSDVFTFFWLQGYLPLVQAPDGQGYRPSLRMVVFDHVGAMKLFDRLFDPVCIFMSLADQQKGEGRKHSIRSVMAAGRDLLGQGTHAVLFPEGTVRTNGYLDIYKSGGVRLLSEIEENDERRPVVMIPVGMTYEPLGHEQGGCRLHVRIGEPFVLAADERRKISDKAYRNASRGAPDAVALELEQRLAALTTLTVSGIFGCYLDYKARLPACGPEVSITQHEMEVLLREVAARCSSCPSVGLDDALCGDGPAVAEIAKLTIEQLVQRGYLRQATDRYVLSAQFELADPKRIKPNDDSWRSTIKKGLYLDQPLEYWRNRIQQWMRTDVTLRTALAEAFRRTAR